MFTPRRILFLILIFAAILRLYGINWDQGAHLHPDERAIVMKVTELQFPASIQEFFSPESSWNPKFFAYGSFPMYLLRWFGDTLAIFNVELGQYTLINLLGRFLSALFDIGTIVMVFLLSRKLFRTQVGLIAAFLYAISVLPIQLSHFYAVDTILTFFIMATLYMLILIYEKPTVKKSILAGLFFGLALATKVSAIVLLFSIAAVFFINVLQHFFKQHKTKNVLLPQISKSLKLFFSFGTIILGSTLATFIFFEPYALIDNKSFWEQTLYQSMMTKDAFVFPYTLQYVGKIPYIYELQNIFFFGLGPVLGLICFLGTFYVIATGSKKFDHFAKLFILFIFFITYFWVVGGFAIGFMRYMLPVYPLLCIFGAVFLYKLYQILNKIIKNKTLFLISQLSFLILLLIWPLSFMQIYLQNNTRTDATTWINDQIPVGKTLATEHWDDGLPLRGQEKYSIISLALYDPDTPEKWSVIKDQLDRTDYIIVASNRLYTPLQKLTDCEKLPPHRCYSLTDAYYKKLFSEELGFKKVAEFTSYPTVPILNIPINDQLADESFTVYDHPKIMIFEKKGPMTL